MLNNPLGVLSYQMRSWTWLVDLVQSLVASRPITKSEEEHDDFVEKLPDFPISSMEDFLSLERELLQTRLKIYFVSLFPSFKCPHLKQVIFFY
jgi:hypothetical protein